MIYLDNAATTKVKPKEVIEAITHSMISFGNSGRGTSLESLQADRVIYQTRSKLAKLIGAKDASRIAFTHNATHALNIAIKGTVKAGDHVITTVMEHNSVLRPLYEMERLGCSIGFAGNRIDETIHENSDNYVSITINDLERAYKPTTKVLICTHASNVTGDVQDIKSIGAWAKEKGLIFIVDASQTMGVIPIDVDSMNIDILCFTGHKALMGPQGTGGIYVKEGINYKSLITGGTGIDTYNKNQPNEMPTALEAGTLNSHGIAGLHAALDYIEGIGQDKIWEKELELMWQFYNAVVKFSEVKVYGDFSKLKRCAIVSINIGNYDSAQVCDELATRFAITTRSGGHCAPLIHKALGTKNQGIVRFSFSHYNTIDEVEKVVEAIKILITE